MEQNLRGNFFMRFLMVILTLFFVYPISPDEIRIGGNAESEVVCCDFEEDQVEGEIVLTRRGQISRRAVKYIRLSYQENASEALRFCFPSFLKSGILQIPARSIVLISNSLRL